MLKKVVCSIFIITAIGYADEGSQPSPEPSPMISTQKSSVMQTPNNIPTASQPQIVDTSNHLQRLYEQGGLLTIDESALITGSAQINKYVEMVVRSTPTAPSTANHVRVFLSTTTTTGGSDLCATYTNGFTQCFSADTTGYISGTILQIISSNTTTSSTTSGSTYVTSHLGLTITTKSSNSNILIVGFVNFRFTASGGVTSVVGCGLQIKRGSTIIYTNDRGSGLNSGIANQDGWQTMPIITVDTPGAIGSYNYQVYFSNTFGSANTTCSVEDLNTSASAFSVIEYAL